MLIMSKRLLILGAMEMHRDIILRAQACGWEVHTVDYLADAPCHAIADVAHVVSTTDIDAVVALADQVNADAVLTFNSDPAAYTAACTQYRIGKPTNSPHTVEMMSYKDKFRNWLKLYGFHTPNMLHFTAVTESAEDRSSARNQIERRLQYPVLIKPADSSGSKGISIIRHCSEIDEAIDKAIYFSRNRTIVAEEYIATPYHQLHGDAFVYNGIIQHIMLGDQWFGGKDNLTPIATTFPSSLPVGLINRVYNEVQRFITKSEFSTGGINIEVRISENGDIYLLEVGPRCGGNYTHEAIRVAGGFDFINATLDAADGNCYDFKPASPSSAAYIVLHSHSDGIFNTVTYSAELQSSVLATHMYRRPGDKISAFRNAADAVGVIVCRFESKEMMRNIIENLSQHCEVVRK